MYESRRYLVIPTTEIGSINFDEVHETSISTLRYSIDGSLTFIKYDVTVIDQDQTNTFINAETGTEQTTTVLAGTYGRPSFYSNEYQEYTHEEMIDLLSSSVWSSPLIPEI